MSQAIAKQLADYPNGITSPSHTPDPPHNIFLLIAHAGRVGFVDAGVSGGMKGASEGTLTAMVGGTDQDVARAKPVLAAFCAKVSHTSYTASLLSSRLSLLLTTKR